MRMALSLCFLASFLVPKTQAQTLGILRLGQDHPMAVPVTGGTSSFGYVSALADGDPNYGEFVFFGNSGTNLSNGSGVAVSQGTFAFAEDFRTATASISLPPTYAADPPATQAAPTVDTATLAQVDASGSNYNAAFANYSGFGSPSYSNPIAMDDFGVPGQPVPWVSGTSSLYGYIQVIVANIETPGPFELNNWAFGDMHVNTQVDRAVFRSLRIGPQPAEFRYELFWDGTLVHTYLAPPGGDISILITTEDPCYCNPFVMGALLDTERSFWEGGYGYGAGDLDTHAHVLPQVPGGFTSGAISNGSATAWATVRANTPPLNVNCATGNTDLVIQNTDENGDPIGPPTRISVPLSFCQGGAAMAIPRPGPQNNNGGGGGGYGGGGGNGGGYGGGY